ncbi:MAG: TldD/PmbA family protein [Firmicutes bacterium]|nr:TldD/PmbA family protein [[Eubacterium] siraeum]MCM1487317.1 TldD/PmbA family protein [Bacillota bacterium]
MINFKQDYYADVRIENRFSTQIRFLEGKLTESKERREERTFVRVFDGEMWYYASTTDTSHIQKTLDGLYAVAKPNPEIKEDPVVKRFEVNRTRLETFKNNSVRDISLSEKTRLIQSYLPVIAAESFMSMPMGAYLDRNSLYSFYSSLGADISYDYQTCGVVLSCSMVEGEKKLNARWQKGETDYNALTALHGEAKRDFAEQAEFMRSSVPVEQGDYPVVLAPQAAGIFAHESFGHKSESDFMISDETMKNEWQIGKQVGSSILTISEEGAILGSGYTPYDDEGTKARKNYLIKDGILAGRLHSAQTAAVLGESVTGNARAMDCTFEPIVRMTNTYIEAGDKTLEELIAPIKKGYFIKTINHGSGMTTFTIAPHTAYEILDGKIGRPVQISVISGNVFETLGFIDGLSDKAEMLSFVTGGCGKMEQFPLPVGFGGPYVRVSRMKVQ